MRFIKIVLIIFLTIIFGGMSYLLIEGLLEVGYSEFTLTRLGTLVLILLFSLVNILYHIKTFRFYRRKEKRNLDKKISVILWIGAICFSSFLLILVGNSLYRDMDYYMYNDYNSEYTLYTFIFITFLLIGLLEVSLLKKRIKRLKDERTTKDEINSIGNLTL